MASSPKGMFKYKIAEYSNCWHSIINNTPVCNIICVGDTHTADF